MNLLIMRYLFPLFILFLICNSNHKSSIKSIFEGKVVKIADGDTFTILTNENEQIRIRLNGIDAPEKSQEIFKMSKDSLTSLLSDGIIFVINKGKDHFGRVIGDVCKKIYILHQPGYCL